MWRELYDKHAEDLEALVFAGDVEALRAFFALYKSHEEKVVKAIMWGRFFLTDFFQDVTPDFHFELASDYFSEKDEYTAAPRGFAKTSLYQALIAYEVANKLQTFIVLIEKSFAEASEVIATVRTIFADNLAIKQVYGELIRMGESGEVDDKSKDAQGDLFINGVRLRGKGFNAPIRGLKSKQYRPSKIILDDIESDEHIESGDQRRKYADNFMQGIVPAKDVTGTIKYIGTILHHDSLLMNLIKTHDGKIFKAFNPLDPENTLLWEDRWTYQRLMQRKKEMEIDGQGQNKFYQEYLNTPIDDERRDFRMEDLDVFFKREDLEGKTCNRYICIDAADSKKDGADYTGVVVVDIDYLNNWYVQFVKRYKINSKEMVELIFNLWEYWKPRKIGVEKNAFTDQVKPWLDDLKEERNVFPIVEELMDGGKRKEDRIRGALQGRLESRKIYFRKEAKDDTMALRGEFIDFPYAKNDDLLDALAYVQQIGTRPFGAPNEVMTTTEQEFWRNKKSKTKSLRNRF
jgi:phage terminase large subunit-like protein